MRSIRLRREPDGTLAADFPGVKTGRLSSNDVVDRVKSGDLRLPPLRLSIVRAEQGHSDEGPDLVLSAEWQRRSYLFAVEVKALATPRLMAAAIEQAKRYASSLSRP